jgi:uncharacterized protein (DUF697 family)
VYAVGGWADPRGGFGMDALAEAIFDRLPPQAQLEAGRAFIAAGPARQRLARDVVSSASALAATVAVTPVPLSDIWLLGPLQVAMVGTIAHLSGRDWNRKTIVEWITSMGLVGGAGLGFRWGAQQLIKLVPGAGSLVSAGVAGAGTLALGRSATSYFLSGPAARPRVA